MSQKQVREQRRIARKKRHGARRLKERTLMKRLEKEDKSQKEYFYKVKTKDGKEVLRENGEPVVERITVKETRFADAHKEAIRRRVEKRLAVIQQRKKDKEAVKKQLQAQ